MRIIIFLPSDHIYANFAAKELLRRNPKDIVLIVESGILIPGTSLFDSLKQYFFTSGTGYFTAQASKQLLFKLGKFLVSHIAKREGTLFYSYKKMARRLNIPVKIGDQINDSAMVKLFEKFSPDIIISLYFRQILKREVIDIPKIGCFNIHPAKLPYYRGISPIFWALARGEKEVGVSLHFITEKIDAGDIIAQRVIQIENHDTEHSLFLKCTKIGTEMFLQMTDRLENNIPLNPVKQKVGKGSYFSFPTREAVKEFKKRKRKFFSFRELLEPIFKYHG